MQNTTVKHTPGPWEIFNHPANTGLVIMAGNERIATQATCGLNWPNAHLIASAPELLEALQRIISTFESNPDDLETMDKGISIARAAIAKATEGRGE